MTSSRRWPRRAGIQLLELVFTLATSSILIAGISSSLFLAAQSRERAESLRNNAQASESGINRLQRDLAEAKTLSGLTSTGVTITVADRNGDNNDETYQYDWPGADQGLRYNNGTDWLTITGSLNDFSIQPRLTPPASEASTETLDPPGQFTFVARSSDSAGTGGFLNSDSGTDLTVNIPATFVAGDLLVAAIAVDANQSSSIVTDPSWTKVFEVNSAVDVSLAVFFTSNPSADTVSFSWPNVEYSHAMVAHFRPPSTTYSFSSFAVNEGNTQNPLCPEVATAATNPLVIRVLGSDQTDAPEDATNMVGHFPILLRSRLLTGTSIGMAYATYGSVNPVPSANFGLTKSRDCVSATLVFLP